MRLLASAKVPCLALAGCLFFCGCGGSPLNKANYDKIENGMTIKEVRLLFGFSEASAAIEEGATVSSANPTWFHPSRTLTA